MWIDISKLNEKEVYWLEYFDAANNPLFYNKTNLSHGRGKFTEKQKQYISKLHKGSKRSKKTCQKMSKSQQNKGSKPVLQFDIIWKFY